MDAVGKPHALRVLEQCDEVAACAITSVAANDHRKHLADAQIVLVVLVVEDVPAGQRSLRQVIREFLLLQRQLIETRHPITQNLDIGEAIGLDLEFGCGGVLVSGDLGIGRHLLLATSDQQQCHRNEHGFLHEIPFVSCPRLDTIGGVL